MQKWYSRFGLTQNPFELDPLKSSYTFVNHKTLLEDILYLVKSGNIFALQGDVGIGKTIFLKKIIDVFEGEGKVVYVDCVKVKARIDIEELIYKKKKTLLRTIFSKKPQDMIVLLDNVEHLSIKNCEKIKYYFDQGHIRSVLLSTHNYKKLDITNSLRDRVSDQLITIPQLNQFDALRIVRDRFTDHYFLADETILELFKHAKKNIKLTLQYCEKLCAYAAKKGRGEALPKYIPTALGLLKKNTSVKKKKTYATTATKKNTAQSA